MNENVTGRRRFLSLAGAALVPLLPASPAKAGSAVLTASAGRAKCCSNALIINALGSLGNPNLADESRTPDARAIRDSRASGLDAVNITIARPTVEFEQIMRDLAAWDSAIRTAPDDLLKVWTAADILKAQAQRRIGVIYGLQNAAFLQDKLDRIDLLADFGLRILQLTYNPSNQLGDGCMAPENRGLSPFGIEAVERLNARKVLVDLSHSGERTCLEAARASKVPITISHTGCRALADLPRNKSDRELRLVAEAGGVVGIYFMAYLKADMHPNAEDVIRHIEHAIDVCGEDHVSIGTDGPVVQVDDLEAYSTALAAAVERRRRTGIGATGEAADTYPFIIDLRGVHQFRDLVHRLERRRHRAARIEKILGRNFLRLVAEVWP